MRLYHAALQEVSSVTILPVQYLQRWTMVVRLHILEVVVDGPILQVCLFFGQCEYLMVEYMVRKMLRSDGRFLN